MPSYPSPNDKEFDLLKKLVSNTAELDGGGLGGGAVSSVNGQTGAVVLDATDLGLGNVDDTADADKPVSEPQRAAIDAAVASVTPSPTGNNLISGGGVAFDGLLSVVVAAATYTIQGTEYSSPQATVTAAAADGTHPRIDVVVVNSSGVAAIVQGTPAANPVKPDIDPTTQLELTFVLVAAGASALTITSTNVYTEGAEYTMTQSGGTVTLTSTNNPRSGTNCIEATAFTTNNYFQAQAPGNIDLGNYDSLVFFIRSKASWANNRQITITARATGVQVGSSVTFRQGTFGFDSSQTSSYQAIVVPTSLFSAAGQSINQIRFTCQGSGGTIGFYVDDVTLQGGIATASDATRLRFRGAYNAALLYSINDVVTSFGITYVCIQDGIGKTPASNTSYWTPLTVAGGDTSTNTSTSVDDELVLFSGTGGKTLKRATTTGLLKASGGVLSAAVAGVDYGTPGVVQADGLTWTARSAVAANQWRAIAYGNGIFVAGAVDGSDRIMTSPDGITWTGRGALGNNILVENIAFGNGVFVVAGVDGSSGTDRAAYSSDGINWNVITGWSSAQWGGVAFGNGRFVMTPIATGTTKYSFNGADWFDGGTAAGYSLCYGNGLFVSVTNSGANRVYTSPDGITWTARTAASAISWRGVAYGNGIFVAVADGGGGDRAMSSTDGITWTLRSPTANVAWRKVRYVNGMFLAMCPVSSDSQKIMRSLDGITWSQIPSPPTTTGGQPTDVAYGDGLIVLVFDAGTNRVFTSGLRLGNDGPIGPVQGNFNSERVGYLGVPYFTFSAAYTVRSSDNGKMAVHPSSDTTGRTVTIPSNASVPLPIGFRMLIVNDTSAGAITLSITTDTLVFAGSGTTGSRTIAADGQAEIIKITSTKWQVSGWGIT